MFRESKRKLNVYCILQFKGEKGHPTLFPSPTLLDSRAHFVSSFFKELFESVLVTQVVSNMLSFRLYGSIELREASGLFICT